MLDNTRLAAIQFANNQVEHIRVYYQDENFIKESCYDSVNKWHTKGDGVVAYTAKKNSPIAATFWNDGKEIRLFYIDRNDKIVEHKYSSTTTPDAGSWSAGLDLMVKDVAPGSQLAVARTIHKGRVHIRLFYQLQDDTLGQTKYESDHAKWEVSPMESESDEFQLNARPGSSLAAASAGGIRLFYQNPSGEIMEIQESDDLWTDQELKKNNLGEKASISLVSWSKGGRHAQIRLYAVKPDKTLVMVAYDTKKEEWKETHTGKTAVEGGAVAAVGTPDGSTSVFYQPTQKVIAMYNADETKAAQLGASGIPTTRLSSPAWEGSLMPGSTLRKIIDQMDPQTRVKFTQRLQAVGTQFYRNWDGNHIRNTVQPFSDEFGLGLKWRSGQDWLTIGQKAASSGDVLPHNLLYASGHQAYYMCNHNEAYLNIFLYADILRQLSTYMGLE